jgi:glyoxylase-like metal-dependent hydrolase (beta-lactamase superfamily II)
MPCGARYRANQQVAVRPRSHATARPPRGARTEPATRLLALYAAVAWRMRVHHLNCISTCPVGGKLMDGRTDSIVRRGHLSCHCLLVESDAGLVLVDTGFGLRDVFDPRTRLSRFFLAMLKPDFREEMTAIRQIQRMGFRADDVRDILLTHLDFDHAGGLDDFPHARVHLLARERESALAQRTMLDRMRYRPQQWSTRANWLAYDPDDGESWFGFHRVRTLEGVPDDIVMIPLVGHTLGHAGIAVRREHDWMLLAGDAYFYHREMDAHDPYCTPGLRFYQWMMQKDGPARRLNQARLRKLKHMHPDEVQICCAHDPVEFERFTGRSARVPADAMALRRLEIMPRPA